MRAVISVALLLAVPGDAYAQADPRPIWERIPQMHCTVTPPGGDAIKISIDFPARVVRLRDGEEKMLDLTRLANSMSFIVFGEDKKSKFQLVLASDGAISMTQVGSVAERAAVGTCGHPG